MLEWVKIVYPLTSVRQRSACLRFMEITLLLLKTSSSGNVIVWSCFKNSTQIIKKLIIKVLKDNKINAELRVSRSL